jgi:hypothetical protein
MLESLFGGLLGGAAMVVASKTLSNGSFVKTKFAG